MKINKFKSAQLATYGINFEFLHSDFTIEISLFDWALPARFHFDPLGWRTCVQFFFLHIAIIHFKDYADYDYDENDDNTIITEDNINFINDEPELKRWK